MRVAVAIPSRGMTYSQFAADLVTVVQVAQHYGHTIQVIWSHGRPQPDAENYITEEALKLKPDYILFLDDDMKLPSDLLPILLKKKAEIIVPHYPVARNQDATHLRDGVFESAGMGCVLIKPRVFEKLERPYFRADTQYIWNGTELEPQPLNPNKEAREYHGLHDVDFFQRLIKAGVEVVISDLQLGQYNLINANFQKYGNQTHLTIEEWSL